MNIDEHSYRQTQDEKTDRNIYEQTYTVVKTHTDRPREEHRQTDMWMKRQTNARMDRHTH